MHLLAPLAFLKTEMTDFPTLVQLVKFLPFHIPEAIKKKEPFRAEPSRIDHTDSPLRPGETELQVKSSSPHVWFILVCIFRQIE